MRPGKAKLRRDRIDEIAAAVEALERKGVCWNDWARERGMSRAIVANVRKNRGPCWRGESRRAADLMIHEGLGRPMVEAAKFGNRNGSQWRPIDTAPRDGTRILGWFPQWRGVRTIRWRVDVANYAYGWWADNNEHDSRWLTAKLPTHWMPLPDPPEITNA